MSELARCVAFLVLGSSLVFGAAQEVSPGFFKLPVAPSRMELEPRSGLIYGIVGPASPTYAGSVVEIDPEAMEVRRSLAVTGTRFALTDDGRYIYVSGGDATKVIRIDVQAWRIDQEVPISTINSAAGHPATTAYASILTAVPGNSQRVAVAVRGTNILAIMENERLVAFGEYGVDKMTFGTDANLLFACGDGNCYQYRIDGNKITRGDRRLGITPFNIEHLRVVDGKIYTNFGAIIDTASWQYAGMFFSSTALDGAHYAETSTRTIYYFNESGYNRYICGYDLDTMTPVINFRLSFFTDSNLDGDFTHWGADGLVFSTTKEMVFFHRSALPRLATPPPSAPFQENGMTVLNIETDDMVHDPVRGRIYASVPRWVPGYGNSIVVVDASTLQVLSVHYAGSRPGRLAISDDAQFLYVAMGGTISVKRIVLDTMTVDLEFHPTKGYAGDLAVVPGKPHSVVVVETSGPVPYAFLSFEVQQIAVYDDGRPRAKVIERGPNVVEFGESPDELFSYTNWNTDFSIRTFRIDEEGIHAGRAGPHLTLNFDNAWGGDIQVRDGKVYTTRGWVLSIDDLNPTGDFPTTGLVHPAGDRVYFLNTQSAQDKLSISAFDSTTYRQVSSLQFTWRAGQPSRLIQTGPNILAFRGETQIRLVPVSLLQGVPAGPSLDPVKNGIALVSQVQASGLAYSASTNLLYATVPFENPYGNSILPIDPKTGIAGTPFFVGNDPSHIVATGDGRSLWVELRGECAVVRVDLATEQIDRRISGLCPADIRLDHFQLKALAIVPNNPDAIILITEQNTATLYSGGAATSLTAWPIFFPDGRRLLTLAGNTLQDNTWQDGKPVLRSTTSGLAYSEFPPVLEGSRLYTSTGVVIDADRAAVAGKTQIQSGAYMTVAPHPDENRIYVSTSTGWLEVFDKQTLKPVARLQWSNTTGRGLISLIPCGPDCLAGMVQNDLTRPAKPFVLRTPVIPLLDKGSQPATSNVGDGIRRLDVYAEGMAYDWSRDRLYISMAEGTRDIDGTVVSVDLGSGTIVDSFRLGSGPGRLRVSPDGHYLYAAVADNTTIQQFDLTAKTLGATLPIENRSADQGDGIARNARYRVLDFAVAPSAEPRLAVIQAIDDTPRSFAAYGTSGVLPNSVPDTGGSSSNRSQVLFGSDATTVYAGMGGTFAVLSMGDRGLSLVASKLDVLYQETMRYYNGMLFTDSGALIDPVKLTRSQVMRGVSNTGEGLDIDPVSRRMYLLTNSPFMEAYGLPDGTLIGSLPESRTKSITGGVKRIAVSGTAYVSVAAGTTSERDGAVYLLNSSLVLAQRPEINRGLGVVADNGEWNTLVTRGSMTAVLGLNLGPAKTLSNTVNGDGAVSDTLAGTRVLVDGTAQPLISVQASRVEFVLSYSVATGWHELVVQTPAGSSDPYRFYVYDFALSLFYAGNSGGCKLALATNEDGRLNSKDHPASAESVVTLYATGGGQTDPPSVDGRIPNRPARLIAPITVTVDDSRDATVEYAGVAPGFIGLIQINVRLPGGLPKSDCTHIVVSSNDIVADRASIVTQ